MISIKTDSCADLGQPLLNAHGIGSVPLHVLVKGEDHFDDDLTLDFLFSSVDQTGELPKTAAPSVQEFIDFFSEPEPVIYIGLSSQLSATMANAELAKDQMNRGDIHLIDSLNLSTGIGLLALKAADLRDAGLDADEITTEVLASRDKVRTAFVIDTMDYLYKGGRCTALQAIFGSMLKIRPIINVRPDGTLGVRDKVRGSRQKALNELLSGFKNDLPNVDLTRVFVTHSGCPEDADYLAEKLKSMADIKDVLITVAGSTIGSHCGPNTIGILFLKN
ncbi:DegV family protein (plasmid) [Chloroflexota bacterium]|nr:DegV family protein [Chloroflexota bacterium]